MQWKSQESKDAHYAAATDEFDQETLLLAEELGNWLESGKEYKNFLPSQPVDPNQMGLALMLVMSEWDGDGLWELLSGIEKRIVAFYAQLQIQAMQELAASLPHSGEADESFDDV